MRGWVSSGYHVEGDGTLLRAAFDAAPDAWLPPPASARGRRRWRVRVRWGGGDLQVDCELSPARDGGPASWRHLVWDAVAGAEPGPGLPHLEGELGLLVAAGPDAGAELTLIGTYVGPFGVLAVAGETAALHEATAEAVRDFLGDLAAGLGAAVETAPTEGSRTP